MADFVGILPAAGLGKRLSPFRHPKELLTIGFVPDPDGLRAYPFPVAEYSLRALGLAGVSRCLVVIADWKTELIRYLGDGSEIGLRLAYVNQPRPTGLSDAIDSAYEWVKGHNVCLALPDTVFKPWGALTVVRAELEHARADLVLGVFPTSKPEQLGPVEFDGEGRVRRVQDKPSRSEVKNTWGVAAWSPAFMEFLHQSVRDDRDRGESPIGHHFDLAVQSGLKVRAVDFEHGEYLDVGMADGIGAVVLRGNCLDEYNALFCPRT